MLSEIGYSNDVLHSLTYWEREWNRGPLREDSLRNPANLLSAYTAPVWGNIRKHLPQVGEQPILCKCHTSKGRHYRNFRALLESIDLA